MGIWAGIKHALNSTLGTKDFEPLDKLIVSKTKTIASDELYESLPSRSITVGGASTIKTSNFPRLKMKGYGTLRLKATLGIELYGEMWVTFNVLKNDETVTSLNLRLGEDVTNKEFSRNISFEHGDVLSFMLEGGNNYSSPARVTVGSFAICGTIKQAMFMEI